LAIAGNALDIIDRIFLDSDAQSLLGSLNGQTLLNAKSSLQLARNSYRSAQTVLQSMDISKNTSLRSAYQAVNNALNLAFSALNSNYNMLENTITGQSFTQSDLDGYKNNLSSQQSSVTAAISSIEAADQALTNALTTQTNSSASAQTSFVQAQASLNDALRQAADAVSSAQLARQRQLASGQAQVDSATKALQMAEAQYTKLIASARPEDVAVAEAQVQQAQASVALINNQLANNQILAPMDGVITEVNYKMGEQVSAGKVAFKMIAKDGYEVSIEVAETDITKIKVGDPATITLDAYGDSVKLTGQVASIEPAATIIQGVIYYTAKIDFTAGTVAVKPSMTATAQVATAARPTALAVPIRAVQEKNGQKFVRVLEAGQPVEKTVTTGLSADGGLVEILNGLTEGEEVITFTKNGSASK
jgi:RND family efflux transporter MFP subunit